MEHIEMKTRGTSVTRSATLMNGRHMVLNTIFRRVSTCSVSDSMPAHRQLASTDTDVNGHSVNSPAVCGIEYSLSHPHTG